MANENKKYYLNNLQRDLLVNLMMKRRQEFSFLLSNKKYTEEKYAGYKVHYEQSIQLCDDILYALGCKHYAYEEREHLVKNKLFN